MCMVERGKVLEVRKNSIIVEVNGRRKEVTATKKVMVGDVVSIFQNLVL